MEISPTKINKANNIILNLIHGLSLKHNLPPDTVSARHLALLINNNVENHIVKRFIVDRFEEHPQDLELMQMGFSKNTLDSFVEIEVLGLINKSHVV